MLTGLLVPSLDLAAQVVSARAVIAIPKSSVRLGSVTERVIGVWGGLGIGYEARGFRVTGTGTRGYLTASPAGSSLDQDVGELSVEGQYDVAAVMSLDLRYAARAFRSGTGRQRWDLVSAGFTLSRGLGTSGVNAFARLGYMPVIHVTEADATTGWTSEVGLSVAPEASSVLVRFGYRVERFGFPQAARRSQQFDLLTLTVGVRARRLGGRWTIGRGKE